MEKKEQIKKIDQFLKSKYGLSLGDWISFNEFIVSGETLSESVWRVKKYLKDKISENTKEIIDRIGDSKFQALRDDLTIDWEKSWRSILNEEQKDG